MCIGFGLNMSLQFSKWPNKLSIFGQFTCLNISQESLVSRDSTTSEDLQITNPDFSVAALLVKVLFLSLVFILFFRLN